MWTQGHGHEKAYDALIQVEKVVHRGLSRMLLYSIITHTNTKPTNTKTCILNMRCSAPNTFDEGERSNERFSWKIPYQRKALLFYETYQLTS